MRLEDWREWPRDRVGPLFEQERARWRDVLGWDAHGLFGMVEDARGHGHLPGFVAVDRDGTVAGWCYANVQEGWLFIGALHGRRAEVVRLLLDKVLAIPEAACVKAYRCFVFPQTPAVATALSRRRFEVEPFLYLHRPIGTTVAPPPPPPCTPWSLEDVPETARLMARAYAGTKGARCFAPSGRLDEWAAYLGQLVRTPACGTWVPPESLACRSDRGNGSLRAVLVTTRLSPETAHVAQLVVDPSWQRQGLAASLVEHAAALAARTGTRHQTLLVAQSNAPARALYARLGFSEAARFLFADRPRISRASSLATVAAGRRRRVEV